MTSSVSGGILIFAICCEKEWPHHRTGASLSILSAYDVIMTDSDTKQTSDTYESYYLAYGLFGIFMKWAKGGYAESAQEI